ncbi:ComEC/Rec2 family competence protein [Thalassorhabdomicrobium marinisediminis]|uniref:Competence protein n=1 Tax=Thalassorhabdomicrobium marinisediminis TaxID=2170577 RepID=A0A2T7G1N4_9RHOB|nr:ComEC/Rec2 family competence protein [Thalassorhabdomicrobium marinisediminis]PVA08317.1 competence protein [Thalassorhabdomicrobium marinisediminis]
MQTARWVWHQVHVQGGHLFGWAPVCLGVGIAGYFLIRFEPPGGLCVTALLTGLMLLIGQGVLPDRGRVALVALALVLAGFGLAGVRAHLVAEPVLGFRYFGPIEGRIVAIDRSQSDAVRLTLDRVVLARMAPVRTPARVRVSLHGSQGFLDPAPGQVVMTTGHLSPPSGPVEPGGFDFQRMAWFEGLGAVGYTRTPLLLAQASRGGADLWVYRLRRSISAAVQARLPGPSGAFAAAITTGDRSGMERESLQALRASNLAHLLAISGMHMGILAAFVFATVRYGLALMPDVALRWPTKKIAAVVALGAAGFYLALSGGNIATERAFIMVAVMLTAVLFDRRAMTLRAVAIAALIVLTLRPEALLGPGFQMSFAATAALVAVFAALRSVDQSRVPRWMRPLLAVFVSSLVAGLATAPFAAYHFNQIARLGLVANLLSVPLMGLLVMPAAVLAAVLSLLGLEMLGLWPMDLGLRWILAVARFISAQDGAVQHVVTPPPHVLAMIALGGVFLVLWRGPLRGLGGVPLVVSAILWHGAERPALLVADSGSLIGVLTEGGRAVSKERGESFAVSVWLENDGAPVPQEVAFRRDGLPEQNRTVRARIGDATILNLRGKTAVSDLDGCGGADLLITNQRLSPRTGCTIYDIDRLRETGALAGWQDDTGLRLVSVRDVNGARLWNDLDVRRTRGPVARRLDVLR